MKEPPLRNESSDHVNTGFVANGFDRAWKAFEAEVRAEVEGRYAQVGKASGILKRWRMLRKIEREIAEGVSARLGRISEESLF